MVRCSVHGLALTDLQLSHPVAHLWSGGCPSALEVDVEVVLLHREGLRRRGHGGFH